MTRSTVKITDDLRIVVPRGEAQLSPASAFNVARELIRRGARRIVREEIDRKPDSTIRRRAV
jgi:hypothetical protein